MATITKTIGSASRDYSTMTLWEGDWTDTMIYSSGDDAVGDVYNDSNFTEANIYASGGGIGLNDLYLIAAEGERHDGTEGTGVVIVRDANGSVTFETVVWEPLYIRWIEVDVNAKWAFAAWQATGSGNAGTVRNCLFHGTLLTVGSGDITLIKHNTSSGTFSFVNNILYDITSTNDDADDVASIRVLQAPGTVTISNNTVHNTTNTNGTGDCSGIYILDDADELYQNNIVTDSTGTASGTVADYSNAAPTNASMSYNAASDTSASGTGSLDSITTADQYVSTTEGSEDLHLKTGADAIDAGTDLGTTPSGVEIDINGRNRDSSGDTWDMGAHELVAVGGGPKGPLGHPFTGAFGGPF